MSSIRREVVFSSRSGEVLKDMDQIAQSAQEIARESLQSGMATTQSAKRTIEAYEQQIKLIERRNKLDGEARRNQLLSEKDQAKKATTTIAGGKAIDKDYSPKFEQLKQESREDKQQTNILRDILTSLKEGNEDLIDSNIDVANMSDDRLRQLVSSGGSGQKSALHELKIRETQGKGKGGGFNPMSLMKGGGLAALGIAGGAIAGYLALMKGGFDSAREREVGLTDYSSLSGNRNNVVSSYTGMGRGSGLFNKYFYGQKGGASAQSLGYGSDEYYSALATGTRSYGGSAGLDGDNDRTLGGLALKRGMGIEQGTVSSLERLTRTLSDDKTATDTVGRVFSTMYGTGALGTNNRDMSLSEWKS